MVDAEEPEGAAEGWLFDSRRNYIEQLGYYVEHTRGIPVSDREEAWIVHRKEVSVIDRC
jgi:hypothetical protein